MNGFRTDGLLSQCRVAACALLAVAVVAGCGGQGLQSTSPDPGRPTQEDVRWAENAAPDQAQFYVYLTCQEHIFVWRTEDGDPPTERQLRAKDELVLRPVSTTPLPDALVAVLRAEIAADVITDEEAEDGASDPGPDRGENDGDGTEKQSGSVRRFAEGAPNVARDDSEARDPFPEWDVRLSIGTPMVVATRLRNHGRDECSTLKLSYGVTISWTDRRKLFFDIRALGTLCVSVDVCTDGEMTWGAEVEDEMFNFSDREGRTTVTRYTGKFRIVRAGPPAGQK